MKTTHSGGLDGAKVPSKSRFGPSSPRYGQFSVLMLCVPDMAVMGSKTAQNGAKRLVLGPVLGLDAECEKATTGVTQSHSL